MAVTAKLPLIWLMLALTVPAAGAQDSALITKESFIQTLAPADASGLAGVKTRGLSLVAQPAPSVDVHIRFQSGTTALADAFSKTQLDELGAALASPELAACRFAIVGHTDSVGSETANLALSEKRARYVSGYLTTHHRIDEGRLVIGSAGEYEPIASNDTAEGRRRNRRVVIKRLDKEPE